VVIMAGQFEKKKGEYNIVSDVKAAQKVFSARWPSIIVAPLDVTKKLSLNEARFAVVKGSTMELTRALMDNVQFWGKGMPGNMFSRSLKSSPTDREMSRSSTLHDSLAIHLASSTQFVKCRRLRFVVNSSGICTEDDSGIEADVCLDLLDPDGLLNYFVKLFCGNTE